MKKEKKFDNLFDSQNCSESDIDNSYNYVYDHDTFDAIKAITKNF
jgi:hypothetical protein